MSEEIRNLLEKLRKVVAMKLLSLSSKETRGKATIEDDIKAIALEALYEVIEEVEKLYKQEHQP